MRQRHAFSTVDGDHHFIALALKAAREHVAIHFVIFDQQYLRHFETIPPRVDAVPGQPSLTNAYGSGWPPAGRSPEATLRIGTRPFAAQCPRARSGAAVPPA